MRDRRRHFPTEGTFLTSVLQTPEAMAARFEAISVERSQHLYTEGGAQVMKLVGKAMAERK